MISIINVCVCVCVVFSFCDTVCARVCDDVRARPRAVHHCTIAAPVRVRASDCFVLPGVVVHGWDSYARPVGHRVDDRDRHGVWLQPYSVVADQIISVFALAHRSASGRHLPLWR